MTSRAEKMAAIMAFIREDPRFGKVGWKRYVKIVEQATGHTISDVKLRAIRKSMGIEPMLGGAPVSVEAIEVLEFIAAHPGAGTPDIVDEYDGLGSEFIVRERLRWLVRNGMATKTEGAAIGRPAEYRVTAKGLEAIEAGRVK